jgi:tRNA nucleotidyltransferase/poly(A) polymerase
MTNLPSLKGAEWLEDQRLKRVFSALAQAGGEARVAGGAVRNALLGEPVADIDIATTLTPQEIMAAGRAAHLGVHPTGVDHGTITLTAEGKPFEVTTLRVDAETFGRKARVEFTDNWEADARRRDFTVNALYCNAEGDILDFVNGYRDILRKRIRFIDDPRQRIEEDYLRILRFFRFHARYGKGAPDRDSLAACIELKAGLQSLSAERIRQELLKLLIAPRAVETVKVMAKTNILKLVIPHVEHFAPLTRMAEIDAANDLVPDPLLRLSLLAKDALSLRKPLRLTNNEVKQLESLAGVTPPSPKLREKEQQAILYQLGAESWRDGVRLAWARSKADPADSAWRALLALPERWPRPVFPVTGGDLLRKGYKPGPDFGRILTKLEDWWIASEFKPGKDEILARLAVIGRD